MRFKKFSQKARTPFHKHKADAGYDLYAPESVTIKGGDVYTFDLQVGFEIPEGWMGIITERSSQGKRGVTTFGNIVDSGYTGSVHATVYNSTADNYRVEEGDRICQIVFVKIDTPELEETKEFQATERGEGGHGSTGK